MHEEIISMAEFVRKNSLLRLIKKFAGKYQEHLLDLNLHHLETETSFLKHNDWSHLFALDMLITYFLYGQMVKNNYSQFFLQDLGEFNPNLEIYVWNISE